MHTNTFAGRMGRWSAQHRKKAIWGWIAFVVIAFVVGNAAGTKQPTHDDYVGDRRRRPRGCCSDHRRRIGQARRDERPVAL